MYAFIEGIVCEKGTGELILLAGGVGYRLICSMNTLQEAPAIGEKMRCLTHLNVREDAVELFGFATKEEKHMFLQLTTVSGVGPKMAMAILGSMSVRDLSLAIALEDITAISRAPGVGKKTAQRIALELKDKISQEDMQSSPAAATGVKLSNGGDAVAEALEALLALGYSSQEARSALSKVEDKNATSDQLVRQALRAMVGL